MFSIIKALASRPSKSPFYPQSSAFFSTPFHPGHRFHTTSSDDFKSFLEPKVQAQSDRFKNHPLLKEWLVDNRAAPKRALAFMTPLMIEFVMGFRDYNEHYLRYPKNENSTVFEQVINAHTLEDSTHSRLFLQDWSDLGLNTLLGWECSDYMRSIMGRWDENMKRNGLKLYQLAYKNPHPFARFALMEVIELAGKNFFSSTADLAQELSMRTGNSYQYFGHHHLKLESGHIENENVFYSSELGSQSNLLTKKYEQDQRDPEFRSNLTSIIEETGNVFVETFQLWLEGAKRFSQDKYFYRDLFEQYAKKSESNSAIHRNQNSTLFFSQSSKEGSNLILFQYEDASVKQALHGVETHRLYANVSNFPTGIARTLTPFALVDILGFAFICRFNDWDGVSDKSKLGLLRNEMAEEIGNMGDALIHDWEVLKLNDYGVGFNASEIMSFKFFDERSNLHRQNFADFFKILLQNNDPLMQCFIFQGALIVYQTFLKKFTPCLNKNTQLLSLSLFNDKWFQNYHDKFQLSIELLESKLSANQKHIITQSVDGIARRFIAQLDHANLELSKNKEMDSPCTSTSTVLSPQC